MDPVRCRDTPADVMVECSEYVWRGGGGTTDHDITGTCRFL